jgi:16S rRNA processing protein RimM
MASEASLCIGKIVGVHGIKGTLKLYSYVESFDFFQADQVVFLDSAGDSRMMTIGWAKPFKRNLVLLSLKEIEDRNQAESLAGSTLSVEQEYLPPLEEDTFYWKDLIGLSVYREDGDYLGVLKQVLPTGSNDVYIVEKDGQEVLIPALKSVVLSVDLTKKTMQVALPQGL